MNESDGATAVVFTINMPKGRTHCFEYGDVSREDLSDLKSTLLSLLKDECLLPDKVCSHCCVSPQSGRLASIQFILAYWPVSRAAVTLRLSKQATSAAFCSMRVLTL